MNTPEFMELLPFIIAFALILLLIAVVFKREFIVGFFNDVFTITLGPLLNNNEEKREKSGRSSPTEGPVENNAENSTLDGEGIEDSARNNPELRPAENNIEIDASGNGSVSGTGIESGPASSNSIKISVKDNGTVNGTRMKSG